MHGAMSLKNLKISFMFCTVLITVNKSSVCEAFQAPCEKNTVNLG